MMPPRANRGGRSARSTLPPANVPEHRYLAGDALVCSDNLDVLRELPDECVDLIYLDPPFNSNQFYVAAFGDKGMVREQLRDIWRWTVETENAFQRIPHGQLLNSLRGIVLQTGEQSKMAAYCVYMGRRLVEMRRALKPTGSIYLHCDPHANAYLRILMDAIFGESNFRNEIVWERIKGAGKTSQHGYRSFGRSSDSLLFYSASDKHHFDVEAVASPYPDAEKDFPHSDSKGMYKRRSPFRPPGLGPRPNLCYEYKGIYPPHPSGWTVKESRLRELDKQGELEWVSTDRVWRKQRPGPGIIPNNIWTDIVLPTGAEKIGYPTQKPLALLERIIKASSNPDDLVMDPFCGCGTAADAAASLGRRYLGIDISGLAVRVMQQRLESRGYPTPPVVYGLEWGDFDWKGFKRRALMGRDEAEDGIPGWAWAEDKVAGLLNAVPNQRKQGDGGVDARYYGALDIDRNEGIIVPIQVKMYGSAQRAVGRPDMDRLLGTQTALQNRGMHAPMSIMVSLYPPSESVRLFAAQQGRVTLHTRDGGRQEYPVMQALSVQEMLQRDERPALPPVDPRALVGDTQDKMVLG